MADLDQIVFTVAALEQENALLREQVAELQAQLRSTRQELVAIEQMAEVQAQLRTTREELIAMRRLRKRRGGAIEDE